MYMHLLYLDTSQLLFFATESKVIKAQNFPDRSGFESWMDVQEFDIANVAALDVDVNENKLYWIDSVEKVGTPITHFIMS